MGGEHQSGFASARVRTKAASSELTGGRPTRPRRDFQVQKARKPGRCSESRSGGERHGAPGATPPTCGRATPRRDELEAPELRSLRSAGKQDELLPQRQVLEREVSAGSERRTQRAQQTEYEGHCPPWLARRWAIVQSLGQDFGKRQSSALRRRSSSELEAGMLLRGFLHLTGLSGPRLSPGAAQLRLPLSCFARNCQPSMT